MLYCQHLSRVVCLHYKSNSAVHHIHVCRQAHQLLTHRQLHPCPCRGPDILLHATCDTKHQQLWLRRAAFVTPTHSLTWN